MSDAAKRGKAKARSAMATTAATRPDHGMGPDDVTERLVLKSNQSKPTTGSEKYREANAAVALPDNERSGS